MLHDIKGEVSMQMLTRLVITLLAAWCATTPAYADSPMRFFVESDPDRRFAARLFSGGVEDVYATGVITEGTTHRFVAFVREHKIDAAKIHFDSPGGSLLEGMKLGRAIRSLQFFTTIGVYTPEYVPDANAASVCASACAYAFAGGTSRFMDQYTGKLGVHQFYTDGAEGFSIGEVQQVSGLIVSYLNDMGIDANAFSVSTIAGPEGMIWLTPDDALRLRFANNGSNTPVAEVKLAGMMPYLRIQQDHYNVTTRVLFFCEDGDLRILFGVVTDQTSSAMFAQNQKRSYLELDYTEFLVIPGSDGAFAENSVVWINRTLTPTTLARLIQATEIGGWIDGFGAVRYGATLQMPTVREKVGDFAKQCYGL